jgi:hypothetical protein
MRRLMESVVDVVVVAAMTLGAGARVALEGQRARMHRDFVGGGARRPGDGDGRPSGDGEQHRCENHGKTCRQSGSLLV